MSHVESRVESRRGVCSRVLRIVSSALMLGGAASALGACARSAPAASASHYSPRTREITVTTVPLLVKEEQKVLPFLGADFATGGVLDGKEVYAFSPSTITVVEGDTIHFTFVNPEDDEHSFVLPDLAVQLPGQRVTHATYVAKRAGIYPFVCSVPSHLPMMAGELVVLSPEAVGGTT
jgi:plastocyanin